MVLTESDVVVTTQSMWSAGYCKQCNCDVTWDIQVEINPAVYLHLYQLVKH